MTENSFPTSRSLGPCRQPAYSRALLILVTAGCVLSPSPVFAWLYHEHVEISRSAFQQACDNIRELVVDTDQAGRIAAICASPETSYCYGHMVALAGDHVSHPSELVSNQQGNYLVKAPADCRDLDRIIESGPGVSFDPDDPRLEGKKLVLDKLEQWVDYGTLASANAVHFQPWSIDEWEARILQATIAESTQSLHEKLAIHAFSTHMLQDSFSSGHIGIDRRKRRQDYAQAYHDDFNSTGRLLKSKSRSWYGYGDGYLDQQTSYFVPETAGRFSLGALLDEIETVLDDGTEFAPLLTQNPSEILFNDPGPPMVLSIQYLEFPQVFCFTNTWCDKFELVVVPRSRHALFVDKEFDDCISDPLSNGTFLRCAQTRANVVAASSANFEALLLALAGFDHDTITARIGQVSEYIPIRYTTLKPTGYHQNNYETHVLGISNFLDSQDKHGEEQILNYTAWGLNPVFSRSGYDSFDYESLSLNLLRKVPGTENSFVEVSFDFATSQCELLCGGQVAFMWERDRALRNVFAIGLKTSVGVNNLWQGREHRSAFLGLGAEIGIHLGKTLIFLDLQRRIHALDGISDKYSSVLTLGFRVSSIDLYPF